MTSDQKKFPVARITQILAELDQVSEEYISARSEMEKARIHFELAREKLALVKRIAVETMEIDDWWVWLSGHQGVQYAGSTIGDAITDVLKSAARQAAFDFVKKKGKTFDPTLSLEQIETRLDEGGFEFRTVTPKREINAALLKLDSAERHGDSGLYELKASWDVLASIGGAEVVDDARVAADEEVPF